MSCTTLKCNFILPVILVVCVSVWTLVVQFRSTCSFPSSESLVFRNSSFSPSSRLDQTVNYENSNAEANSRQIKQWRQSVRDSCASAKTAEDIKAIKLPKVFDFDFTDAEANMNSVVTPVKSEKYDVDQILLKHCSYVILDFGANIGDTFGHIVDSGLPSCDRTSDLGSNAITNLVHFNITSTEAEGKRFVYVNSQNELTKYLRQLILSQNPGADNFNTIAPEDYCYYGVEGNPLFSDRLRRIEQFTNMMKPRPIRYMHYLTESVVAGADGPTKLYLDTVNPTKNFWGSSIFESHPDVRKSATESNGSLSSLAVDVMAYTLSTLMKKTLISFKNVNGVRGNERSTINRLILKVDIEGGEYPMLDEVVQEGTLCAFVADGHTADLFIEFHGQGVTGKNDYDTQAEAHVNVLTSCGVKFHKFEAGWARH